MFISNTATAVLLAPIALQSAMQIGVSPVPFLFAVTVGASMCFASPFSTPPNALVMPAGQYTFIDYHGNCDDIGAASDFPILTDRRELA